MKQSFPFSCKTFILWLHSKKLLCTHASPQPLIQLTLLAQENGKYRFKCGWKKRGSVVTFEWQQLKLHLFVRKWKILRGQKKRKGPSLLGVYCACACVVPGTPSQRWVEGLQGDGVGRGVWWHKLTLGKGRKGVCFSVFLLMLSFFLNIRVCDRSMC